MDPSKSRNNDDHQVLSASGGEHKGQPVVGVFDIGKTNKKIFLFDEQYKIVFEESVNLNEIKDEDGFVCEDLPLLCSWIKKSVRNVCSKNEFDIRAINFAAYGASFVYIDNTGKPLTPLYNYLKPYPEELSKNFYQRYGGEEKFSLITASPILGSLNSGMQLYRIKKEQPRVFERMQYALHLPQYLGYLLSGKPYSDLTSIGCHTHLWDFQTAEYHQWVQQEGIYEKLAPIMPARAITHNPDDAYATGVGIHDSSAALVPYLQQFSDPFVLISTGTWCISLNPFNHQPLSADELRKDCLCYLDYRGRAVKASRLFAGYEHDRQVSRIADHFQHDVRKYKSINFNPDVAGALKQEQEIQALAAEGSFPELTFERRGLSGFESGETAYHRLILDIIGLQKISTGLVLNSSSCKKIFVDGGFSSNPVYMHLLASAFPQMDVFAASMKQATAMGAAMVIHDAWNKKEMPVDNIQLKRYDHLPGKLFAK